MSLTHLRIMYAVTHYYILIYLAFSCAWHGYPLNMRKNKRIKVMELEKLYKRISLTAALQNLVRRERKKKKSCF